MRTRQLIAVLAGLVVGLARAPRAAGQINPVSFPHWMVQKPIPALTPARAGDENYQRLTEIMVELAWLADPLIFPLELEACMDGEGLQVRGQVPNDAVKQRALKLARMHCPITVVDKLTGLAGAIEPRRSMEPASLQQAVLAALHEAFPRPEHTFAVRCLGAGQVVIEGFISSFEEKLAVSRRLRRLAGCTAVVNELALPADARLLEGWNLSQAAAASGIRHLWAICPAGSINRRNDETLAEGLALAWSELYSPAVDNESTVEPPAGEASSPIAPSAQSTDPLALDFLSLDALAPGNESPSDAGKANDGLPPSRLVADAVPVVEPAPNAAPVPDPLVLPTSDSPGPNETSATQGVGLLPETEPRAKSDLAQRIGRACPAIHDVEVVFKSAAEVEIHLVAANADDATRAAQLIMHIPELLRYRVDVRVQVPVPNPE